MSTARPRSTTSISYWSSDFLVSLGSYSISYSISYWSSDFWCPWAATVMPPAAPTSMGRDRVVGRWVGEGEKGLAE